MRIFFLFSFFFVFFADVKAQKQSFESFDSLFQKRYKAGKFHGNILLAEKGKIVYNRSFGKADEATGAELNENSIFELASVSKQFTAMAVAILEEKGKLAYQDKVTKYIPTFPYPDLTVLHLLHHTSGLADYMELMAESWDTEKIATNADIVQLLADKKPPLRFQANEQYEYSNTGYALLAVIIEKVSEMEFGTFLEKHIFVPLEMTRSFVYRRRYRPQKVENYAYGYVFEEKSKTFILPDTHEDGKMAVWLDGIVGDGTVNSTVIDLLKWDRALYTEKLVSKKTIDFIHTSGKLNNGKDTGYGLGVEVGKEKIFGNIVSHSGSWIGYSTYLERHIDNDKTIIILQNRDTDLPNHLTLLKPLYDLPAPAKKKEVKVSEKTLKKYVGLYAIVPEFKLNITLEDKILYVQATGQNKLAMFATSETRFVIKNIEAEIEFYHDGSKKFNRLVLFQNGQEMVGKR